MAFKLPVNQSVWSRLESHDLQENQSSFHQTNILVSGTLASKESVGAWVVSSCVCFVATPPKLEKLLDQVMKDAKEQLKPPCSPI